MKKIHGLETRTCLFFAIAVILLLSPFARVSAGTAEAAADKAAENLGRALQFKTISFQDASQVDAAEFKAFHAFLEKTFPLVHKNLTKELVNNLGLLYTWKGSDASAKPIIFLAHIDVVPIAPGTMKDWTYPPFEGKVADGFIWGRGTMDCKGDLMALMEAVEALLAQGYRPRRTVYLAFGQDEEVGGDNGAGKIAALLKSRGVSAEFVNDEGGMIVDGKMLGVNKPLAMVGIAEKGYLSLELKVKTKGGHSSMPPKETAIGVLAAAIVKLEKNPFPARVAGVPEMTFKSLAPELPSAMKFAAKNVRLFSGLLKGYLAKNYITNAMIRTTIAPTIINAGTKENVLPQEARAVVNFRLLPGDSMGYVTGRVKKIINDPRVTVEPIGKANEASIISDLNSEGYKILKRTIAEVFPDTVTAPMLVLGGTDSKHFEQVSDSLFRFAPIRVGTEDQERGHGTNERVSVSNYGELIKFYTRLIRNSD